MDNEMEIKWIEYEIDKGARIAAEVGLEDYVKRLEAVADVVRSAAEDIVRRSERVSDGYKGSASIDVLVERINGRTTIKAKYGDKTAEVELGEEIKRYALLANLALMATSDLHHFNKSYVYYYTSSFIQAVDGLFMLSALTPGEYILIIKRVRVRRAGLSPLIGAYSYGPLAEENPVYRLILKMAKELDTNKYSVLAWLIVSVIFNAPDGGKPSEGLTALVERLAIAKSQNGEKYKAILEVFKPYLEELDVLLGPISREDKIFLASKLADYKGSAIEDRAIVDINNIRDIVIRGDVEIFATDIAVAAANAFSGWRRRRSKRPRFVTFLGVRPVGPTLKVAAAFKDMEQRLNELLRRGESIAIGNVEITSIIATEIAVEITHENLNEIINGFKNRYYTHLRLIDGNEKHDLHCGIRDGLCTTRKKLKLPEKVGVMKSRRTAIPINRLSTLLSAGIRVYAVRKAKSSKAMWHVRIKDDITMELKMSRLRNYLYKRSKNWKIEAIIDGKPYLLDLKTLAEAKCDNCVERLVAETLNKAGVEWWITPSGRLFLHLPLSTSARSRST